MSQPFRALNLQDGAPGTRRDSSESHADWQSSIDIGRSVISQEAAALQRLADSVDETAFNRAAGLLYACRGNIVVCGMGKAGLIGQKIAATLASTGTPAHFLHPAEAVHGDLGRVRTGDVVVCLSHSGETEEIIRVLSAFTFARLPIVAITGRPDSRLAREATVTLEVGRVEEAGALALAPTTSTTAMLALGDAMAIAVSQRRGFTPEDFARFHPGGALGRKLSRVEEVMRPFDECRVADQQKTVREVFISKGKPGRRSGAILVTDERSRLVGIFTDSDLARLLENQRDSQLDQAISTVMTRDPVTVVKGTMLPQAIRELQSRKISELPVINTKQQPIGLIDITDVVAFLPEDAPEETSDNIASNRTNRHGSSDSEPQIISLPNRNDLDP